MNKFRFYFILFSTILVLFSSCKEKDIDELEFPPANDQTAQSKADDILISKYLDTHFIESVSSNFDIKISPKNNLPLGTNFVSLKSYLNNTGFPKLVEKKITISGVDYKVYYLVLREGIATKKPTSVDDLWIAYSGQAIADKTIDGFSGTFATGTEFDTVATPTTVFSLFSLIQGWKEIIPMFGAGEVDTTTLPNDPVSFINYGAGVMFIPSGLGYFDVPQSKIPAYSPLLFSFKLLDMKRSDIDRDGIESINEDLNANGVFTDDDTDADGIQNYLDNDDDNDGYPTRLELKKTDGSYYEFAGAPDCTGNVLSTTRIRKYLDPTCN